MRLVINVPPVALWRALVACKGVCLVDGWPCRVEGVPIKWSGEGEFALLRWIDYDDSTAHTLYLSPEVMEKCTQESFGIALKVTGCKEEVMVTFLQRADPENMLRGAFSLDMFTVRPICIHGPC